MHILDFIMYFVILLLSLKLLEILDMLDLISDKLAIILFTLYTLLYIFVFVFPYDLNWVDIFSAIKL